MNESLIFDSMWWLLLLLLPLALLILHERRGGAQFGAFHLLQKALKPSKGPMLYRIIMAIGISSLIIAAARPQYGSQIKEYTSDGRDLMLVIDLSYSMKLDDMTNADNERISRLAAVFQAAHGFIEGRPNDRIGLVFFSDLALNSCPLTLDHATLHDILKRTQSTLEAMWSRGRQRGLDHHEQFLLGMGTNISAGLGYAIKTVDQSKADEKTLGKALILITDGKNSRIYENPMIAAKHAKNLELHIHSIGVGDPRGSYTETDVIGRKHIKNVTAENLPDMNLLRRIAKETSGIAMRAGNRDELKTVFAKIDELEPSPRNELTRDNYTDKFMWPLLIGLICCSCGLLIEPRLRGALA